MITSGHSCSQLDVCLVSVSSGAHALLYFILSVSTCANPTVVGAFCMQRPDWKVVPGLDMEGACWVGVLGQ